MGLIIFELIILIIMGVDGCNTRKRLGNDLNNVLNTNQTLNKKVVNDSISSYEQVQMLVSEKTALQSGLFQQLSDVSKKLTKLEAQIKINATSGVKNFELPVITPKDTIWVQEPGKEKLVPYLGEFQFEDRWLKIRGYNAPNKVYFEELMFSDSLSITLGKFKKKGIKSLFKKPQSKVIIETTSKYSNIVNANNIVVDTPRKMYGLTLTIGYGWTPMHPANAYPFIGLGISRTIVSF